MITLNSDRGLIRITSWTEVEALPGFTPSLNPHEVTLDRIIGSYREPEYRICGLSNCRTKHYRGYLVAAKDGRITNMGKDCGKTHFGVDFETMARTFDFDLTNAERREKLHAFKNRIEEYVAIVDGLKSEPKGGAWLNKQVGELYSPDRGLPLSIRRVLGEMLRIGSAALKQQRLATAREIELSEVMKNPTPKAGDEGESEQPKKRRPEPRMIEVEIGTLSGLAVLHEDNGIKKILVNDLEVKLKELRSFDVDAATPYQLGHWAKWVGEVDTKLRKCRELIDTGRQFFERENIAQLAELAEDDKDEIRVMEVARRY